MSRYHDGEYAFHQGVEFDETKDQQWQNGWLDAANAENEDAINHEFME